MNPLSRCPGVMFMLGQMTEPERMRRLAEQVRYELIWRVIDKGVHPQTGERVISLDYNFNLLEGNDNDNGNVYLCNGGRCVGLRNGV